MKKKKSLLEQLEEEMRKPGSKYYIHSLYNDAIQEALNDGILINFHHNGSENEYATLEDRRIYICVDSLNNPTVELLFDLYHEIGHVVTNEINQKRYYQEYLATEYAIKRFKKLGLKLPAKRKREWQEYIYKWRETSIKLRGKNILPKEKLVLSW